MSHQIEDQLSYHPKDTNVQPQGKEFNHRPECLLGRKINGWCVTLDDKGAVIIQLPTVELKTFKKRKKEKKKKKSFVKSAFRLRPKTTQSKLLNDSSKSGGLSGQPMRK